jgi:hypothetical protein
MHNGKVNLKCIKYETICILVFIFFYFGLVVSDTHVKLCYMMDDHVIQFLEERDVLQLEVWHYSFFVGTSDTRFRYVLLLPRTCAKIHLCRDACSKWYCCLLTLFRRLAIEVGCDLVLVLQPLQSFGS